MKHHTLEYARVRVQNLRVRIAEVSKLDPSSVLNGFTAAQRVKLDMNTLKKWLREFPELKDAS